MFIVPLRINSEYVILLYSTIFHSMHVGILSQYLSILYKIFPSRAYFLIYRIFGTILFVLNLFQIIRGLINLIPLINMYENRHRCGLNNAIV